MQNECQSLSACQGLFKGLFYDHIKELTMKNFLFSVEGMTCGGCASKVEKALKSESSNCLVKVDLAQKSVSIEDTDKTAMEIKTTIEKSGFKVTSFKGL